MVRKFKMYCLNFLNPWLRLCSQCKSSSDKTKELRSHIMRWKLRTINTFSECIFVQWLKQHYSVHYYCNPSCTIEIKSSQVNAINSFYNSKWQSACSSISIALHCTFAPFDSYSLHLHSSKRSQFTLCDKIEK